MKLLLTFFFALFFIPLFAQIKTTNDLTLVNEVSVRKFIGKKFRASVDIKNIPTDSIGRAGLFILQVGKGDYDFVPKTSRNIPATNIDTNWHTYKAGGTISNNAQKIWLYINTKGDGDFYYDNFKLQIEEKPDQWIDVSIPNSNFEESTNPLKYLKVLKA